VSFKNGKGVSGTFGGSGRAIGTAPFGGKAVCCSSICSIPPLNIPLTIMRLPQLAASWSSSSASFHRTRQIAWALICPAMGFAFQVLDVTFLQPLRTTDSAICLSLLLERFSRLDPASAGFFLSLAYFEIVSGLFRPVAQSQTWDSRLSSAGASAPMPIVPRESLSACRGLVLIEIVPMPS